MPPRAKSTIADRPVNPQDPATWLEPGEPLIGADGRDWSWCYAWFEDVPGHPGYRAGWDGSIWSCWRSVGLGYGRGATQAMGDRWKCLSPDRREYDGRKRYTLRRSDGTYRRAYGAAYVLEAFVGPCPPGRECCHWDGDCTNDATPNLRWDTKLANGADRVRHGTVPRGESHPKAKLSDGDIGRVIERRARGESLESLAIEFGVSGARISQVFRKGAR